MTWVWPSKQVSVNYGLSVIFCCFFIPLALIGFCYASMLFSLRRKNRFQSASSCPSSSSATPEAGGSDWKLSKAQKNITKTLLLVSVAFIVCWTPNQLFFLFLSLGFQIPGQQLIDPLSTGLCMANCCVNPFIYALKYDQFKVGLRRLICCKR
jgi:hypothetical protein